MQPQGQTRHHGQASSISIHACDWNVAGQAPTSLMASGRVSLKTLAGPSSFSVSTARPLTAGAGACAAAVPPEDGVSTVAERPHPDIAWISCMPNVAICGSISMPEALCCLRGTEMGNVNSEQQRLQVEAFCAHAGVCEARLRQVSLLCLHVPGVRKGMRRALTVP